MEECVALSAIVADVSCRHDHLSFLAGGNEQCAGFHLGGDFRMKLQEQLGIGQIQGHAIFGEEVGQVLQFDGARIFNLMLEGAGEGGYDEVFLEFSIALEIQRGQKRVQCSPVVAVGRYQRRIAYGDGGRGNGRYIKVIIG